jgi:hypothetical protein
MTTANSGVAARGGSRRETSRAPGMFSSFIYLIHTNILRFFTTNRLPNDTQKANEGPRRPRQTHQHSLTQGRPAQAPDGQRRPTTADESQRRPRGSRTQQQGLGGLETRNVSSPRCVFFFLTYFIHANEILRLPDPTTAKPDPEGQRRPTQAHDSNRIDPPGSHPPASVSTNQHSFLPTSTLYRATSDPPAPVSTNWHSFSTTSTPYRPTSDPPASVSTH